MNYLDKLLFNQQLDLIWEYNFRRKTICCNTSNKKIDLNKINKKNVETIYLENNFLNIKLKKINLLELLTLKNSENKKIHIEHTSANPVGRLHIGNLRLAYYGDTLKRLNIYKGNFVITEYYINDLGNACAASLLCYLKHPEIELDQLYLYYTKHKEEFNQNELRELVYTIETSDTYKPILDKITHFNLNLIIEDLNKMQIYFEQYIYESNFQTYIDEFIKKIESKFLKEQKLLYFKSSEITKEIIRRSNGSYTYIARDIVHTIEKINKNYDKYYTIVGQDHQLFKTNFLNLLLHISDTSAKKFEIDVIKFLNLDSEKMSKRKNNILYLDEIPDLNSFRLLLASTDKQLNFKLQDLENCPHMPNKL